MPVAAVLPPLTAGRVFGSWQLDPTMLVAVVVLGGAYLAAVRRRRAAGEPWPVGRTVAFLGLGLGSLVIATMSALGRYDRTLFWVAASENTVLLVLTPIGLALGDPIGLVGSDRVRRWLRSPPVRFLTFPLVSSLLGIGTQFLVYFTPYFSASLRDPAVREVLHLQLVVTGVLFTLPLLSVEFLPSWCTYPVRAAIAFVDGILDALPGIVVMTSSGLIAGGYYRALGRGWGPSIRGDQRLGGGAMLGLAELIAIPFLAAVFLEWVRADAREAVEVDRRLDAADEAAPDALMRPWWETDARLRRP